MKLLLDTHIWLWSLGEPQRLSGRVAKALDDRQNELWLSPISIWEAFLLFRKKRVQIATDFTTWLAASLSVLPVVDAPLTFDIARTLPTLRMPHVDPADLFLAATAKAFDLTLITADRNLIRTDGISVLAN
ncbi:MAG TPA: type II toxin-antitoxin system VapC family toxin [Candidatus Sulfotelmatobacter sp.]|nr:type II toxin-antitoxin system VapC family toxin [Candidatus Sulfotelmatobacter sp.]